MATLVAPVAEQAGICSLENYLTLPDNTMDARIAAARRELGDRVVVLGHHYQRDEVIRFADFRGDSYKLAQEAARSRRPSTSFSAACISWPKALTCLRSRSAGDPAGPQCRLLHG